MSRESRMELIRRRGRNEHQTQIRKFLDQGKDPLRRLKALKNALERTKPEEVKEFFNSNASIIFYVVYASFTTCEDAIQHQKGKKSSEAMRDLNDLVLPTLEEILITLPELLRKQWQLNSICLIIRKLLHPQNNLPLRFVGIRLLVIWVQCLQGNGGSAYLELFASAIPGFPPPKTQQLKLDGRTKQRSGLTKQEDDGSSTLPSSKAAFEFRLSQQYGAYLSVSMPCLAGPSETVGVSMIRPLSVVPGNDNENGPVTMDLMSYLLECLTTQVGRLKWDEHSDHIRGFSFLFFVYKLLYLSVIYKGFRMGAGLYSSSPAPMLACVQRQASPHGSDARCDPLVAQGSAGIGGLLPSVQEPFAVGEPSAAARQPSQTSGEQLVVIEASKSDSNQPAGEQLGATLPSLAAGEQLGATLPSLAAGEQLGATLPSLAAGEQLGATLPSLAAGEQLGATLPSLAAGEQLGATLPSLAAGEQLGATLPSLAAGELSEASSSSVVQYPIYQMSALIEEASDLSSPVVQLMKCLILKSVLRWLMSDMPSSTAVTSGASISGTQANISGEELMKRTFMSSRENTNLLLEILKQGFVDASFSSDTVLKDLISLYNKWMTTPQRPIFMTSPAEGHVDTVPTLEIATGDLGMQPWEALSLWGVPYDCDVRAGLQPSLHMCVDHTSRMFLTQAKDGKARSVQVDMCKRIIKLYQDIVTAWLPDQDTWSYILAVLLHLAQELLIVPHVGGQDAGSSLGDNLASELLKTLLLCFVRASLAVKVSSELWDSLLYVMSSLTGRKEAILQWKAVMEAMTYVLAYSVYNLNLHNLPLNKAREERHVRPRSKTVISTKAAHHNTTFSKVSFFRSPAQLKLPRNDGHDQTTSTPTRPRPTSIRPPGGMPSPVGHGDLSRAMEEVATNSPPLPNPPDPVPNNAGAQSIPLFDEQTAPDSSVIVNPHVMCLSPDPLPITSNVHRATTDSSTEAFIVKNFGCQEVDPSASLGAPYQEPSTPLDLEQDSDSETKSTSSSAILVVTKLTLRGPSPPPPPADDPTRSPSKVRSPSPSGGTKSRERSVSSSSVTAPTSGVGERGHLLSKASSEGNLLGSSSGLLQQVKSNKPLLEISASSSQKQQQQQKRQRSSIRRVVSTDMAHRSTEAVDRVGGVQQDGDSFCLLLQEEEEVQANTVAGTRHEPWPSGEGALLWMRESSRFTQHPSWSQLLAAVVWQRMLKILGDVNVIADPLLHTEAMTCLQSIWKSLFDIEANLGVSLDSQPPCEPPVYAPPLLLIFPWVVKACSLPDAYTDGRRVAYELLCSLIIKHSRTPCSLSDLAQFYRLMHSGLCGGSVAVRNVAVKSGCKLFSHGCTGSTVLLSDCVSACSGILNSKLAGSPRQEALTLLGSVLYLPELYPSIYTLENGVVDTSHIKEQIVNTVLMAARQEPTRSLRCFALHILGILTFKELRSGQLFSRCDEAMDILFASLQFPDHGVALSAVDMLSLLREVFEDLLQLCPHLVTKAIESLCIAAAVSMGNKEQYQTIIPILLCLRDWFMMLPSVKEGGVLPTSVITTVFEVLHIAAAGAPFPQSRPLSQRLAANCLISCTLEPITASLKSPQSSHKGVEGLHDLSGRIQTAARSVLTHLLNLFGHFPFGCGAAQLSSVVEEYHDSPSLDHLTELSSEVFDSPRVQFFALNKSSVITLVEIPTKLGGIPEDVRTSTYQTRVIVRDVTGKYCWDSAILYGGTTPYEHVENVEPLSEDIGAVKQPEASAEGTLLPVPLTSAEGTLLPVPLTSAEGTLLPVPSTSSDTPTRSSIDASQPLSWKALQGTSQDVLHDLLKHIESTSSECVIYPGSSSLTDPAPAETEHTRAAESVVVTVLEKYDQHECSYAAEAFTASSMCGDKARAPEHLSVDSIQFQHCRVFLSHLGMLSWSRRNHLDLLKKDNQLILELRNLDQAHSRQTYKVAVLYVALGQEDKRSILRNTCGSREFEDFVAGLGWEVDLKTHAGYLGGLQREFYSNSLPYYATSSEEILFHVATRMPSKGTDDDRKVRHLGNDEVHIVWSEHWRDYRRTIFRTQFADFLIVIYPQPSGLYRIQIDSRQNVSPFGPLFDGALVDRNSLPILVRATAINILRAQRHPTVSYRRRYEERMKYIQTVITQNLMKSSYEEFAQNVMHPLSFDDVPKPGTVEPTVVPRPLPSTVELRSVPRPPPYASDASPAPSQSESKRSSVTKIGSLFSARRNGSSKVLTDRPESEAQRSTVQRCEPPPTALQRNHSVPENLSEMEMLGESHHIRSPSSSSQSNLHKKTTS